MHFRQFNIAGCSLVGLYGIATDRYAILSPMFPDNMEEVFNVPILRMNVYSTNILGLFMVGNSSNLLVPSIILEGEMKKLKSFFKENNLDVNIHIISARYNALGNLIACNDRGALIRKDFFISDDIEEALDVKKVYEIEGYNVGSVCVSTNKGFLVGNCIKEEIGELSKVFGVKGTSGTVCGGANVVGSSIIANSNGYVTGLNTTGFELGSVDEGLGFL